MLILQNPDCFTQNMFHQVQTKLALPSHSGPLQWEKIGKAVNWAKLAQNPTFSIPGRGVCTSARTKMLP